MHYVSLSYNIHYFSTHYYYYYTTLCARFITILIISYKRTKQSLGGGFRLILGVLPPLLVSLRALLQPLLALLVHFPLFQLLLLVTGCVGNEKKGRAN